MVDIYPKGGRERERYFNSTTEITPVNALETNHRSSSCQYALLFFISCAVGDDSIHHHFLSLYCSRCHILSFYLFTLLLTPLRTCLKVCLLRVQSRFWRFMDPWTKILSVPHSLVVKCMVAHLFPIPSDNRHYSRIPDVDVCSLTACYFL